MSHLATEILLRLAKAGAAGLVALALYLVLTGPLGQAGSVSLALLSWIAGAAFVLLVQSSPI